MTFKRTVSVIGLVLGLASLAPAEEGRLPALNAKPKTIALFKNGLGFFVREGDVRPENGWAVTDSIPQASLGSLWMGALDPGTTLEQVVSLKEERPRNRPALSVFDLFKANVGRKVAFNLENKPLEGRIKGVLGAWPAARDAAGIPDERRSAPAGDGEAVMIETPQGDVVVSKHLLNSVRFPEPPSTLLSDTETVKRLKFKVAPARAQARIGLIYLQKGISWTPAYLLNLVDDQKVRMTMQALVVNDAEDFEGADLLFVVGYPHFIFSDILSPLSQDQSLAQFLNALSSGGRRSAYPGSLANIAMQRVAEMEDESGPGPAGYFASSTEGAEGTSIEDLFFYRRPAVALKKGERALYPIFSEVVDYRPVYEWNVPDTANVDSEGALRRTDGEKERDQVWHSLKLKNSTSYPWTTAPAMAVRDGKPMAQEILDYTSPGSSVNLKITVATDIQTNRQETEAGRQRGLGISGRSYDLVTVKGELRIKNNRAKPLTLDVRKTLTGEAFEVSHQGKVRKSAEGLALRAVNPRSLISWEVPLKEGQETTLTYQYKIHVSR